MLRTVASIFAADDSQLDAETIHRVLVQRELLASTGVGSGVAIPHGRLAELDEIRAALVVHKAGVPFEAIDGRNAKIIVAILSPEANNHHLRVLADVSRRLRKDTVREAIVAATSAQEALDVLLNTPQ